MYSEGEHSTGNFGTIPRGKFGKLCLKPPVALIPRVHMGPIVEAAVPRRSDELPPPSPSKDVPNDLSLRSLSNSASHSRVFALMAPTSLFAFAKSARKAATFSSDRAITLQLAVPAPRRCLSYILPPLSRSPMVTVPAISHLLFPSPFGHGCPVKFCTPPSRLTNVYVAPLARLNTCSNANTPLPTPWPDISIYRVMNRQLRQRQKEKRRVDSRPLYINEKITRGDYMMSEHTCRRSLPPHQINYPASQSRIY